MSANTLNAFGKGERTNNLDMPMIHGRAIGIVRRGAALLAILLLLSSATLCQLSTSAANSLQHRMNVTACGYGLFDCDESQLTPSEVAEVDATRHRVNVTACGYGFLGCNEAQLTPPEVAEVNAIRHRVNVTACGYGFLGCSESQLTPSEVAEVSAIRRRVNVTACEYGFIGCNESKLTSSEIAEVNATRQRMSTLVSGYDFPAPQPPTAATSRVSLGSAVAWSPAMAENGSYYGELNKNGVPKTVHVNGYFRSNGTYVRGYYRSAPGTNPR